MTLKNKKNNQRHKKKKRKKKEKNMQLFIKYFFDTGQANLK